MVDSFRSITTTLVAAVVALIFSGALVHGHEQALAEQGKRLFFRCAACHSLSAEGPAMFGPHLEDIVGRTAGTVAHFEYTDSELRAQAFVWDEEYFEEWLQHPQAKYPQMCVPFRGLTDPEARRALFVFLRNPIP